VFFPVIFRSGAVRVSLTFGTPAPINSDNEYEAVGCRCYVEAGECTMNLQIYFLPDHIKRVGIYYREIHDSYAGSTLLKSLEEELALVITVRPSRQILLSGTVDSDYGSDPAIRLEFESSTPSDSHQETLDQLDNLLCILYPGA
jgi:hypothetical protein